ncbi:DUF488 family protein [Maricaulis sp.]|uniref:DUF488 domain-containing protein n=1 Tax=Maricaulis sp. TaxID=1486257 RepID=UPI003A94DC82
MIATIGYEAASLEAFINTLKLADIDMIVDVRDRAQSRRKGFSKTALSEALANSGIGYKHFRVLGDPKEGREAARSGDWAKFRAIYAEVINSAEAQQALEEVVELANDAAICLLCYERDPATCHRRIISNILDERLGSRTQHLGVRSFEQAA